MINFSIIQYIYIYNYKNLFKRFYYSLLYKKDINRIFR